MKMTLCLIGLATLFLTNGCVIREHDRGGYYGRVEVEHGEYRSYPEYRYHRYPYRGHYPYSWEGERY